MAAPHFYTKELSISNYGEVTDTIGAKCSKDCVTPAHKVHRYNKLTYSANRSCR
jgi:hypothetical protein